MNLIHMETRSNLTNFSEEACLLSFLELDEEQIDKLLDWASKQLHHLSIEKYVCENGFQNQEISYPKHVSDLDYFRNICTKFEPELQTDHPGFSDKAYRKRRSDITCLAFNYNHGQPLPLVEYNENETNTWKQVYNRMKELHKQRACKEYLDGLKLLENDCGYSPDRIPQLETVSRFIQKQTGFRLRPIAGLLSPRDFLNSLAFRVFQCTQYVRHHAQPFHTPEPDCIHELLGHMPLMVHRGMADFSQLLGLASIGATDEDITKLSTLYWFTVEFGLCKENGEIRAFGAGLLSSTGELENAFSNNPRVTMKEFVPETVALEIYDDVDYQTTYFVTESLQEMKTSFIDYVNRRLACRQHYPIYDPITETVTIKSKSDYNRHMLNQAEEIIDSIKL